MIATLHKRKILRTMQKRTAYRFSTGCQRCKRRRVDCDETIPACTACTTSGEDCPGYAKPLRWSRKHEILNKPPKTRSKPNRALASNIGTSFDESPDLSNTTDLFPETNNLQNGSLSRRGFRFGSYLPAAPMDSNNGRSEVGPSLPLPDWMQISMLDFDELTFQNASINGQDNQDNQDGGELTFANLYAPGPLTPWPSLLNSPSPTSPVVPDGPSYRTSNISREAGTPRGQGSRQSPAISSHTPPAGSAGSLLHTFYRLSQPKSAPGFAEDDFVNYYFKHVARLFTCFDSSTNPFRTLVADCWKSNRTVSLTIQSMAIAHLSNWYPYMAPLGLAKRKQAWKLLQRDLKRTGSGEFHSSDNEMLSLLLLGVSSSWHISSNLGLQFLTIARNLIKYRLQYNTGEASPKQSFFEEALLYWEMLTSFVDPVPMTCFPGHGLTELPIAPLAVPKQPHPWTGISTEIQFAFAEIGRLLRRQRSTSGYLDITDPLEVQFAEKLDGYLTNIQLPTEDQIVDFDDSTTSKQDLVRCALLVGMSA